MSKTHTKKYRIKDTGWIIQHTRSKTYILANKRFGNTVNRVTTYPDADIGSDHNPLVADIKVQLKSRLTKNTHQAKIYININELDRNVLETTLNNNL